MSQHNTDEIAVQEAAYYIWLNEGKPTGHEQQHWARAVEMLKAQEPKAKKTAKTTRKASVKAAGKPKVAPKKPATKRTKKATKAKA